MSKTPKTKSNPPTVVDLFNLLGHLKEAIWSPSDVSEDEYVVCRAPDGVDRKYDLFEMLQFVSGSPARLHANADGRVFSNYDGEVRYRSSFDKRMKPKTWVVPAQVLQNAIKAGGPNAGDETGTGAEDAAWQENHVEDTQDQE